MFRNNESDAAVRALDLDGKQRVKLRDRQSERDYRELRIDKVGVRGLRFPIQVRDKARHLRCEVAIAHLLRKFCIRELVYQLRQGFDEGLIRRQSFFVTVAHQSCGSCRKTTPGKLADDTGLADPSLSRHQHYVPASRPDTLPHSIHRCQFFLAPEKFAGACDC